MQRHHAFSALFICALVIPLVAHGSWPLDGAALSTAASDQNNPMIVSDGAGGAIVTWYDYRGGAADIYAQRVNSWGVPQWTANGVALSTAASDQYNPTIVSDGAGGAIVTWYDYRGAAPDIYAQRVNASGVPQWTPDGVALCTAANTQQSPTIVSDGAGGAIVTWYDYRSGTNYDIYARRVNASGVPQWTADGVALCTAANTQQYPTIVADGAGGAIVTWYDYRSGTNWDIYARRVNASGVPQWTADGVALSTAANEQYDPKIVSDGAGGAIVTWYDFRSGTNYDIYAQRVSPSGFPQWAADGVALCTAASFQHYPTIVSDGAGGAIVTWVDTRSANADIYAQRVSPSGVPQWTADGVALSAAPGDQNYPKIVSDGAGGAIVTWYDYRNANYDIYARRVNASGVPQWTADGVALSTAANEQYDPKIVSDGAGGAIVTWYDFRSGTNYDIYAQRVSPSGFPQWAADGVALCTAASFQHYPTIVSDGAGGAIVTWVDTRSANADIYAQRVSPSGVPQWTADGVALSAAPGDQNYPKIVSDGAGGAIVTWYDYRNANYDIYARRVNASGVPQWTADGVALCTAANNQEIPTIASDGAGGAIVTWVDIRSGTNSDIYAQRIERNGYWGFPSPGIVGARDVPGDQGGVVNVSWDASRLDPWPDELIDNYTVWRAIDPSAAAATLASGATTMRDRVDPMPVGARDVVRIQEISGQTYYWKLISTVQAYHLQGYSEPVPTLFDSTASSSEYHYFQVMAHDGSAYWASAPDSGQSVDNIAPAAPLQLTAQRMGADVHLVWNRNTEPDLRDYAVYRHSTSGVTPTPVFFLSSAEDTVLVDANAPTSALYYIVTAFDVHENQGAPSNEASASAPTGVGDTPRITALTIRNYPNPFAGTTELEIGLPEPSDVAIDVYDVAGRRVGGMRVKGATAGWRRVAFDGRDDAGRLLPSGVYFYRVRANGATVTRKMVITR